MLNGWVRFVEILASLDETLLQAYMSSAVPEFAAPTDGGQGQSG